MSKKRNIGVKNTKTEYIAFIDSDAYPNDNWITNGEKLLSDKRLYHYRARIAFQINYS